MTNSDQAAAVKLYALLYNGANLYNVKPRKDDKTDPLLRYVEIVKEFKHYLKANKNGK